MISFLKFVYIYTHTVCVHTYLCVFVRVWSIHIAPIETQGMCMKKYVFYCQAEKNSFVQ